MLTVHKNDALSRFIFRTVAHGCEDAIFIEVAPYEESFDIIATSLQLVWEDVSCDDTSTLAPQITGDKVHDQLHVQRWIRLSKYMFSCVSNVMRFA